MVGSHQWPTPRARGGHGHANHAAQAAIDGDAAMRATVPHAAHLWQYTDARPTNEAYRRWELDRLNEFGAGPQLRLTHTDGYIDDFMGAVYGRRKSYAVAAVHRAFIGKGGADFPLKAPKECLPMPPMVALGGSLGISTSTAAWILCRTNVRQGIQRKRKR